MYRPLPSIEILMAKRAKKSVGNFPGIFQSRVKGIDGGCKLTDLLYDRGGSEVAVKYSIIPISRFLVQTCYVTHASTLKKKRTKKNYLCNIIRWHMGWVIKAKNLIDQRTFIVQRDWWFVISCSVKCWEINKNVHPVTPQLMSNLSKETEMS